MIRAEKLRPERLLKNPGMKNCESFCLLVKRDDGVGRAPRLRSNEANIQKGCSPTGFSFLVPATAANLKPYSH